MSNFSENDPRKTQYLSAIIVKTPSLLTTFFYEFPTLPAKIVSFFNEFSTLPAKIITFSHEFSTLLAKIIIFVGSVRRLPKLVILAHSVELFRK